MSSRIINSTPPDSTVIKSGSDDNRPLYLANDEGIRAAFVLEKVYFCGGKV